MSEHTWTVVRGEPTEEELAAVVVVLSSLSAAEEPTEEPTVDEWNAPTRMHRQPIYPGGAAQWWASGLPRS